jgi:membrane protease YdiL (CAAX protease family)
MRRWSFWTAIAVMLLVQLGSRGISETAAVALALLGTLALVLVARLDGLSWADLGLSGGASAVRGARWAAIAVVAAAFVYGLLLLSPARDALQDDRTPLTLAATLTQVLVVIPIQTVVWEEVAFRGVLWAILKRDHGWRVATAVSSVLFGLWHILPAITFADASNAVSSSMGTGWVATWVAVTVTVTFTGLAGLLLCELRRRSGSLLAPMGAHWAANGLGTVASYLA